MLYFWTLSINSARLGRLVRFETNSKGMKAQRARTGTNIEIKDFISKPFTPPLSLYPSPSPNLPYPNCSVCPNKNSLARTQNVFYLTLN